MHESTVSPRDTVTDDQASTPSGSPRSHRWRVVDIVVAAVLGVAVGVVFWGWEPVSNVLEVPFKAGAPGLQAFVYSMWLLGGVLGGLVVRKPGAALFVELVAASVEQLIGTQWGLLTLLSGLVQGLGAEIVFAVFLYRVWRLPVAWLAGAAAGLGMAVNDLVNYYGAGTYGTSFKTLYVVSGIAGGAFVAGTAAWLLTRALAATGALSRFASGRSRTLV